MKSYFHKIAKLGCGWNERPMTEEDFFELCDRFGVNVEIEKLRIRGVYYRVLGKDHISISDKLNLPQRLQVMFHEFGHFLMHTPGRETVANFSGFCVESREEKEADAFAYCAILPLKMLKTRDCMELADMYGMRFFMKRLAIFERYGV